MTTSDSTQRVWAAIDVERGRDHVLKRVSIAAWVTTLGLFVLLLVFSLISTAEMIRAALHGYVPWASVVGMLLPVIMPLIGLAVIVAVLTTIALFLRARTATLQEIQLRLAALEDALGHTSNDEARS
jgi:uncharacterized membrane protein